MTESEVAVLNATVRKREDEELMRALVKAGPQDRDELAAWLAEKLALALDVRAENRRLEALLDRAHAEYTGAKAKIGAEFFNNRKRCGHWQTRHHVGSGNNDNADECLLCGKVW